MKKFIALLLTGIFVFGAAGCSYSSGTVGFAIFSIPRIR